MNKVKRAPKEIVVEIPEYEDGNLNKSIIIFCKKKK